MTTSLEDAQTKTLRNALFKAGMEWAAKADKAEFFMHNDANMSQLTDSLRRSLANKSTRETENLMVVILQICYRNCFYQAIRFSGRRLVYRQNQESA